MTDIKPEIRRPEVADAVAIAAIYNEGIAGREATFESEPRQASDFLARLSSDRYELLLAATAGQLLGWAGTSPYSDRQAYAGIAEFSIYVASTARGCGVGTALCQQLSSAAESHGFYKLVGKIFPSNLACIRLVQRCGFQTVGLHRRHGRLDGRWRDVLLVERLLGDAYPGDHPSQVEYRDKATQSP